ncbi:SHOCT domain-containing protein [Anaeromicrobium sediminis]|uniref:SHOCT domain-containing protein n=1 Tax=Anaeromicrobium sediminis TaxID=1478221 RepID=A0A267MI40_9FIRM|nr:SHOCT domain-containing protein [Anaeromicrobium sediminis]PAB58598.1 hypothetical protein CCE28_14030 [Anaeromicrobium sediminis]
MMLLWIPIIIFLIIHFSKDNHKSIYGSGKRSPLEILDEKFISGELTEEEYKRKKDILRS